MTPDEAARLEQLHAKALDCTADPAERIAAAREGVEMHLATHDRDVLQRITALETILSAHRAKGKS